MQIYTDGACSGNPGPGGWAFIILKNGIEIAVGKGGVEKTTNNQMEMQAVIEALKALEGYDREPVELYSDSQYIIKGVEEWMDGWKKRGWKTFQNKPVKNLEQWKEIDLLNSKHDIQWNWVKAHNGNVYNEAVDKMAVSAVP